MLAPDNTKGTYYLASTDTQILSPKLIPNPIWGEEYHANSAEPLFWKGRILRISFSYPGSYQHEFKAYLLDSSTKTQKTYTLYLKDKTKEDKECREKVMTDIAVNLSSAVQEGATFKVLQSGFLDGCINRGSITYRTGSSNGKKNFHFKHRSL